MLHFFYEWGGQEYNQTLVNNVENADLVNKNVDLRVLTDRWKKPGDIAQFKKILKTGDDYFANITFRAG